MNIKNKKGGQLSSNILEARSRLRSPTRKNYRNTPIIRSRKNSNIKRLNSTFSLNSLGINSKHGEPFKVGDKYYTIEKNPETSKNALFIWTSNSNSWSLASPSKSVNNSSNWFGGSKKLKSHTRKNSK